MKKISILVAICVLSLTGAVLGQKRTQHISFDDNLGPGNSGTYNSTDAFGVDLYLTYEGYNSTGLSLWFDMAASAAPHTFITAFTWGPTFTDRGNADSASYPIGFTVLESDGRYGTSQPSDFGGILPDIIGTGPVGPGTYFLGHLSIDLAGLAPGIYTLQTDSTGGHSSEVTSFDGTTFEDNYLPVATYTITVVPEPSAFASLIVTAVAAGFGSAVARLRKKSSVPVGQYPRPT